MRFQITNHSGSEPGCLEQASDKSLLGMAGNDLPLVFACALAGLLISTLIACARPLFSSSIPSRPGTATTYYVDCSARMNGNGTERAPWNALSAANAVSFQPGDHLLLKRSTTCNGALIPRGSGAIDLSIVIDAYGKGALPKISGGNAEEALKLFNQQYWEINNLEITGGSRYGIYVSGDIPNSTINHIYLRKLDVRGAAYTSTKRADSGEVFISPNGVGEVLNDVLIDSVRAHDSHVAEGIFVSAGGAWIESNNISQPLGSNVVVQNSIAHDVYGDGILIAELNNGLLQRNVVYNSGLCPNCTGSTPVGLWEWYCHTCTVQYNESYANQSWGDDGGDFDIDYFNDNNVVQYNYGHDSAGYCVAFFGAGGRASRNNIFRYNICSNNGRRSDLSRQGEIYLHTWDGGSLDGVQIYNNTLYWNPASNAAAFVIDNAIFSAGGPRFFKNNIVYAKVPAMIQTTSNFALDYNIYWTTSASAPAWRVDATVYTNFSSYRSSAQEDIHSHYSDPRMTSPDYHAVGKPVTAFHLLPGSPATRAAGDICGLVVCSVGSHDFWGYTLAAGPNFNIGADQSQ
jgi:hypothetical protein